MQLLGLCSLLLLCWLMLTAVLCRYVLELMQHQKSDFLEWTIIVLISAEIVLSLYELFIH